MYTLAWVLKMKQTLFWGPPNPPTPKGNNFVGLLSPSPRGLRKQLVEISSLSFYSQILHFVFFLDSYSISFSLFLFSDNTHPPSLCPCQLLYQCDPFHYPQRSLTAFYIRRPYCESTQNTIQTPWSTMTSHLEWNWVMRMNSPMVEWHCDTDIQSLLAAPGDTPASRGQCYPWNQ